MRRFSTRLGSAVARSFLLRMGTLALFALAAGYAGMAWHIVFVSRIGPIVGDVNAAAGQGIHAGDVLAIPLLLLAGITVFFGVGLLHAAEQRTLARSGLAHRR